MAKDGREVEGIYSTPERRLAVRPEMSPTARALRTLELVQAMPGVSAGRLAERLGVSERAARRYVAILREAGIPIESVRGPSGGYRAGRGLRLPPLTFSSAEALSLVMAVLDGHHDASDPDQPVGSALGKIVRALPGPVAAQAAAVRQSTSPVPDRAAARPDPATTASLVDACSSRRPVRFSYRSEAGSPRDIDVDPWAVVVRHGRWYLLCRSHSADAQRAYRVDRIRSLQELPGTFEAPAGLDPVTTLEQHLAVGWDYEVEVLIAAPAEAVAPWLSGALGRLEPVDDASCRLVASTSEPSWYVRQLAAIPMPYRIVRCPELQQAALELAQRLQAAAQGG
jgi:predicted DNA-binding transcriptional regulator YafY